MVTLAVAKGKNNFVEHLLRFIRDVTAMINDKHAADRLVSNHVAYYRKGRP